MVPLVVGTDVIRWHRDEGPSACRSGTWISIKPFRQKAMIVAILKLCSHLLQLLLLILGLILKLPLNFLQIDFQLLLGCLKVLLLLLNVCLLSVYNFLETSHRVQELLRQIDQ